MKRVTFIVLVLLLTGGVCSGQWEISRPTKGQLCLITRIIENNVSKREFNDTALSWVYGLDSICLKINRNFLNEFYYPDIYNDFFYQEYFGDSLSQVEMQSIHKLLSNFIDSVPAFNSVYQHCGCENSELCCDVMVSPLIQRLISVRIRINGLEKSELKLLFTVDEDGDIDGYKYIN